MVFSAARFLRQGRTDAQRNRQDCRSVAAKAEDPRSRQRTALEQLLN